MPEAVLKTHAEMIADICAAPENRPSPELLARMRAVPQDDRDELYGGIFDEVDRWLLHRSEDDFEVAFRLAVDDLVSVAAFVLRAMKKRFGDELSPAIFAKYCYRVAEDVLFCEDFEAHVADTRFSDVLHPPPPPPDIPSDEIDRAIVGYLSAQAKPCEALDIDDHVLGHLETIYGAQHRSFLMHVGSLCYKSLRRLERKEIVGRKKWSYWLIDAGSDMAPVELTSVTEPVLNVPVERVRAPVAEESIGEGDELIYVYFNEAERKLAQHEGRDWWPCKVGFTSGNLSFRLIAQRPQTGIGRLPVVGLVIKTDNGRALERALHLALDRVAARIDEAGGNEWFETSPARVKDWHAAYEKTMGVLKR